VAWVIRITDERGNDLQKKKFPDIKKEKALEFAGQIYKKYGRGKLRSIYIDKE